MLDRLRSRPRIHYLLLALIIIVGVYLRFERLADLAYFQLDEEKDAFLVRRILVEHKPILVAAGIPGGINMGPLFIYISSIVMFLSHMNPIGEAFIASLVGGITIVLTYVVGRKLFNASIGIFAALFYSLSYLVVVYDRIYWPLVFNPFISLLTYLFLYKTIKEKKWWSIVALGALAILMTQSEASNLATLATILVVWVLYHISVKSKAVVGALVLFLLGQTPLIVFDLRHEFLNTRRILAFIYGSSHNGSLLKINASGLISFLKSFSRFFLISGPNDLVKQILPCPKLIGLRGTVQPVMIILTFLLTGFFLYQSIKHKNFGLRVVSIHFAIIITGILVYNLFFPGYVHEWFYYGFFPAMSLIVGYAVYKLWKKNILQSGIIILLVSFAVINIRTQILSTNSFGLKQKMQAVKYAVKSLDNDPFYLNSVGQCYSYGGYRYLFWLAGREPITSYMDAIFGDWVYPLHRGKSPTQGVIIVNHSKDQRDLQPWYLTGQTVVKKRRNFGTINVLIVEEHHEAIQD